MNAWARSWSGGFNKRALRKIHTMYPLRRMSEQVVGAIESLAGRQAEIWKSTIDNTHEQWFEVSVAAARTIKSALSEAVEENLVRHAQSLNEGALKVFDRLDSSTVHHAQELNRSTVQIGVAAARRHGKVGRAFD